MNRTAIFFGAENLDSYQAFKAAFLKEVRQRLAEHPEAAEHLSENWVPKIAEAINKLPPDVFPLEEEAIPTLWLESSDDYEMAESGDYSGLDSSYGELLAYIESLTKLRREAVARGLHDPKEEVHQAVVDGSPTKDVDRNVEMVVLLDRKDSVGSQYSALYWVERMYQALTAHLFSNPQEAFDSIMIQAKAKGLSEKQETEILKWLGAMGLGVKGSDKALENHSREPMEYNDLNYKQKQVRAGFSVASKAMSSLAATKAVTAALSNISEYLNYYAANKPTLQAKVRVAELGKLGFSNKEILKSCVLAKLDKKLVIGHLLKVATMDMEPRYRVEVENADSCVDVHFVAADSEAKAKSEVKDLYDEGAKIKSCEEIGKGSDFPKQEPRLGGKKIAQTPPPPPPSTPVSPGKKRVFDQKLQGWIEIPDTPTTA